MKLSYFSDHKSQVASLTYKPSPEKGEAHVRLVEWAHEDYKINEQLILRFAGFRGVPLITVPLFHHLFKTMDKVYNHVASENHIFSPHRS